MSRLATAMTRTAHGLLAVLRRLPLDVQAVVKAELAPVGRLDYAPRALRMSVASPWQAYRLRSCRKEPETVRWLETELRAGDCFYDIGANVGAYSLVAFAVSGGGASIVAFEPSVATYAELCRNILLNDASASITPVPIALGERTGIAQLHYSELTAGAARHAWAGGETELALATASFRLDELVETLGLPAPNLLKLDVDGPELEILRGAPHTLARSALRSCLVELDEASEAYDDVVALLGEHGLRVASRHVRGGGGTTYNVIFTRA